MTLQRAQIGLDAFRRRARNSLQTPNSVAFRWGAVVSREIGGVTYQLICYVSVDNTGLIAYRTLPNGVWTQHEVGSFLTANDAHNTTVAAIDADGYVHVAYDHHNSSLHYRRSTNPLGSWDGTLTSELSMLGTNESNVTYPQFIVAPTGEMYFTFLNGISTDDTYLYVYDESTQTWSAAPGTGTGGIMMVGAGDVDGRFYPYRPPSFSSDWDGAGTGAMHWMMTKRKYGVVENYNLYHVKYDGTGFESTSGATLSAPIADDDMTAAITIGASEILLNEGGFCLDADDLPHVAYWKNDGTRYQLYHSHYNGSAWVTDQITAYSLGALDYEDVGRPAMRCDLVTNQIYIWFSSELAEGVGIWEYVSDPDDFTTWTKSQFFDGDVDNYEPVLDIDQWETHGLVCMLITQGPYSTNLRDHIPLLLTRRPAANTDTFDIGNWSRKHAITIDADAIGSGGVSDFTVKLGRVHFADEVCSPTNSNRSAIDGGDLRFFSDSSLTTRIPCAVVRWEHDSTDGAGDADIAVRVGPLDLSDSVDTTIYVAYGNATAVQPWVAETYGARAVFDGNWLHCFEFARNTIDIAADYPYESYALNDDEFTYADGKASITSADRFMAHYGTLGIANAFSIAAWLDVPASLSAYGAILAADRQTTVVSRNLQFRVDQPTGLVTLIRFNASNGVASSITGTTDVRGSEVRVAADFDTTDASDVYVSGAIEASDAVTTANGDRTTAPWTVGWRAKNYPSDPQDIFAGAGIGHLEIHSIKRGAAWWATDAVMFEAPAAFATAGAGEAAGGGGTVTVDAESAGHTHTAGAAEIYVKVQVGAADSTHAHTAAASTLGDAKVQVGAAPAEHSHTVNVVSLGTPKIFLGAASARHGHTAEPSTLTLLPISVAAGDAKHPHKVDLSTLGPAKIIVPAESAQHTHIAEPATLTLSPIPVGAAESVHTHTAGTAGVQLATELGAGGAKHLHTADASWIRVKILVGAASARHTHRADAGQIIVGGELLAASARHIHRAAAGSLGRAKVNLSALSAQHGHTVEPASLGVKQVLGASGASHTHTASAASIDVASLAIGAASAKHAHTSESAILGTIRLALLAAPARHRHTADGVLAWETVAAPPPYPSRVYESQVVNRVFHQTSERRVLTPTH